MSDDEVMEIIYKFNNLITKYSRINNVINEDLKQEIIIEIYPLLNNIQRYPQMIQVNLHILVRDPGLVGIQILKMPGTSDQPEPSYNIYQQLFSHLPIRLKCYP